MSEFRRDFSDKFKLSFRSFPEVLEVLGTLQARFRARGLRLADGRTFSREALGNGLVMWFAAQPAAEQERVLLDAVARLNELMMTEPVEDLAVPPGPVKRRSTDVRSDQEPPSEVGPKRRKKGG